MRLAYVPLRVLGLQETQVGLPLVPDDLAAGETANRDDHPPTDKASRVEVESGTSNDAMTSLLGMCITPKK